MRNIVSFAAILSLLVSSAAFAGDPAVQRAIDEATGAAKKANSVGFEWRDTGKMIKKAQAAADKGDDATAMKWANMARDQGVLGYKQYESQKNAGPRF